MASRLPVEGLAHDAGGVHVTDDATTREQFQATFAALKTILKRYEPAMVVQTDEPTYYYLNTGKTHKKKPVMFAAVRLGKSYVSYHLMPIYGCRELVEGLSEPLRARMQGKACFNFKVIEPDLLEELTRLTELSLQKFKRGGFA
jgi:hypothetical protein